MYPVIDKSNEYYLYDHKTDKTYFIGDKNDLIKELAKGIVKVYNFYNDDKPVLKNKYIEDLNMTGKDYLYECYDSLSNEYKIILRRFSFFNGFGSMVDVREYEKEVYEYAEENGIYNLFSWHSIVENKRRKRKKTQWRTRHNSSSYYHSGVRTKRTKTLNSIPESKEFVRGRDKVLPSWWDDTSRDISCSWKDQSKDRKQWEHKVRLKNKKTYISDYIAKGSSSDDEELFYLKKIRNKTIILLI